MDSIWSIDEESGNLDPRLDYKLQECLNNMNIYHLNDVQKKCLDIVLKGESGLICAPRRTGKTLTILLIAFQEMILRRKNNNHPQIIIICKTLELTKEMNERALEFVKFCPDITIKLLTKGKEKHKNQIICEDIVIGTPDKIDEISSHKALDLRKIQTLIADDADCMVPMKECIGNVMNRIRCQLEKSCRLVFFSCTKTTEIADFMNKHPRSYQRIVIPQISRNLKRIFLICSNENEKRKAMVYFITKHKYPGQSVVICNSKENASQLAEYCANQSCNHVYSLLGNMKEKERADMIKLFNDKYIDALVTTPTFMKILSNVHISLIFNFDQLLKDRALNKEVYEERESMIGTDCQGIVVNVIEKAWAPSICQQANLDKYEIKKYEELTV